MWLIPVELPGPDVDRMAGLLDDDERRRAEAFRRAPDRDRFVVAHAATRLILAELLGVPPTEIRWSRGPHGKPRLVGAGAGTQTSLSHSGGLAALAVARARPVGVDLQRLSSGLEPTGLSRRFYPDNEARYVASAGSAESRLGRFVRLWTRKEACVKAAGGRLMQGLRLPVRGLGAWATAPPATTAARAILVHDPQGPLPGPYVVRDVPAPPGYRAAVAAEGERWYPVSRRRWVTPARGMGPKGWGAGNTAR